MLVRKFDVATFIEREVGVAYCNTKSGTHKACDHYEAPNDYIGILVTSIASEVKQNVTLVVNIITY